MARAKGHTAVMADKASAAAIEAEADPLRRLHLTLNYFPTPPWATRALLEHVIPDAGGSVWEPAAGQGHMARVLAERFDTVFASDVHDYGSLDAVGSFVGAGGDVVAQPRLRWDWVITNPPFSEALGFAGRALNEARNGVAMLLRTPWLEGVERYESLFRDWPPQIVAVFVERVPMTLGRWDPEATTATSYAWFVWDDHNPRFGTELMWIPPGCRQRLTRPDDISRFAGAEPTGATLFDPRSAPASETNEVAA